MGTPAPHVGTIPLTAFDIDAVARVTGLSISQLRRWDRTGFFHPSLADPNRRRPGSRIYSKDDVIALRTIAKLREAGVPLAHLKSMRRLLAPDAKGNEGWHAHSFHVAGTRVYLSGADAIEAARLTGRRNGPTTIDVASVKVEVEEAIERLRERRPEEIGQVIRRRAIMSCVPIIAGTRIPTETIAWFHDHGYSLTEILENFPRLTPKDVDAAIAFENQQEMKSPEPILVQG